MKLRDRLLCLCDRGLFARVADGYTFRIYKLDVGDAQETEKVAQISALCVGCGACISAAARREHIPFLALEKPFSSLRRIAERRTGAPDVVEVCLERRRDVEVVH